jgi:hypothetical protein
MTTTVKRAVRLPKIKAQKRVQTFEREFFNNLDVHRKNRLANILSIHSGNIVPPHALVRAKHWDSSQCWHFIIASGGLIMIGDEEMLALGRFVDSLGVC